VIEAATPAPPPAASRLGSGVDPYHPPPRDTLDAAAYKGWQQYSLQCARCHGEDAQGTSFAPSLLVALRPDGHAPTQEDFIKVLLNGRDEKGMPPAGKMGLEGTALEGLYAYLKGRSDGHLHGGRPARRDH
jgi:mono/diheme cytochrome c family protein